MVHLSFYNQNAPSHLTCGHTTTHTVPMTRATPLKQTLTAVYYSNYHPSSKGPNSAAQIQKHLRGTPRI
ncbi:Glycosyltransferase-like [Frankliniella fusca]|uniref:Glycosyltransferase-like n=1 Tax=Frankliniella fusca TaxID=407009 RepID=A0AAE1H0E8_9NEOP|nr:Glycosyltransferase-like [Frankliniella fusca]